MKPSHKQHFWVGIIKINPHRNSIIIASVWTSTFLILPLCEHGECSLVVHCCGDSSLGELCLSASWCRPVSVPWHHVCIQHCDLPPPMIPQQTAMSHCQPHTCARPQRHTHAHRHKHYLGKKMCFSTRFLIFICLKRP